MKKSKGGNEPDVDMISNLPDPILHLILSRIPTTVEVVRTSILSRRWRYLWTSVPSIDLVYLECYLIKFNKKHFEEFACRVLQISSLDLDSFRLCCGDYYDMSTVGRWIDAAVRRNVKLLHLTFSVQNRSDNIEFPHCLLTCGSLEELKLSLSANRLSFPKFTGFLALRVLELEGCKLLNYDLVHNFFKSLTLLEDLSLIGCETYDFRNFNISCPNLKNLRIESLSFHMVYELCNRLEICCPKLVFMEIVGFMSKEIILESLDSLKKVVIDPEETFEWSEKAVCDLFAGISHVESLSLHIGLLEEEFYFENVPKSLPNLKTLELTTTIYDTDNLDVLIQILTFSPNLESFHLTIEQAFFFNDSPESPDFDILKMECTFEQLKIVEVKDLSSSPDDIRFIEFVLKSTPFLESINITPRVNMSNELFKYLVKSVELLNFRASTKPEIIFVQDHV